MSDESVKKRGLLVVISGFSGGGKGTLIRKLMSKHEGYALSVSATTRAKRPGERDGVDYFFVDDARFREMVAKDELLEYAQYVGHFYGTPRVFVENTLSKGKDCILEIDLQGAMKVKEKCPDAILIFVTPPSARELMTRLKGRGTESEETIEKRLLRASVEAMSMESYDYILINDELNKAAATLHAMIQIQHMRPNKENEIVKKIREELK